MFAFAPNAKLRLRPVRAISISAYSMTSSITASEQALLLLFELADLVPSYVPWNLEKIKAKSD